MYGLIIGLTIFASILLILVVLVQKPKGGGLATQFSSSNLAFGVKRTSDFIEKATWGLAIAIIVLSISSNLFIGSSEGDAAKEAINSEQLQDVNIAPQGAAPLPSSPTPADNN